MSLAFHGTSESDFDAVVTLYVLVLGFSFAIILATRFFARISRGR